MYNCWSKFLSNKLISIIHFFLSLLVCSVDMKIIDERFFFCTSLDPFYAGYFIYILVLHFSPIPYFVCIETVWILISSVLPRSCIYTCYKTLHISGFGMIMVKIGPYSDFIYRHNLLDYWTADRFESLRLIDWVQSTIIQSWERCGEKKIVIDLIAPTPTKICPKWSKFHPANRSYFRTTSLKATTESFQRYGGAVGRMKIASLEPPHMYILVRPFTFSLKELLLLLLLLFQTIKYPSFK